MITVGIRKWVAGSSVVDDGRVQPLDNFGLQIREQILLHCTQLHATVDMVSSNGQVVRGL